MPLSFRIRLHIPLVAFSLFHYRVCRYFKCLPDRFVLTRYLPQLHAGPPFLNVCFAPSGESLGSIAAKTPLLGQVATTFQPAAPGTSCATVSSLPSLADWNVDFSWLSSQNPSPEILESVSPASSSSDDSFSAPAWSDFVATSDQSTSIRIPNRVATGRPSCVVPRDSSLKFITNIPRRLVFSFFPCLRGPPLTDYRRSRPGSAAYKCPQSDCDFTAPSKKDLKRHLNTKKHRIGACDSRKDSIPLYRCPVEKCKYASSRRDNFTRHMGTVHERGRDEESCGQR